MNDDDDDDNGDNDDDNDDKMIMRLRGKLQVALNKVKC